MRGLDPKAVDDEVARLREAGLLDDERFAAAWVAGRQRTAPRGRRMLRYELLGRGIAPDAVEKATASIDDLDVALAAARSRVRKAPAGDYNEFATRVGGYLQRRGFSYEVVMAATRSVWAEMRSGAERDEEPLEPQV
jgi:regulatory protein